MIAEGSEVVTFCHGLKLTVPDGGTIYAALSSFQESFANLEFIRKRIFLIIASNLARREDLLCS